MNRSDCPFGFRVVGPVVEARRLVDATAAFSAHAACDPLSEPDRECYLSAFRYGPDFATHMQQHHSPKGYAGACWSPWCWIDIDRPSPTAALDDARRLVGATLARFRGLDEDDLLLFFSGGKGYHVGVPLAHAPAPSALFHLVCRRFAERLAAGAGVAIDTSIYDRVRCFRAPNSRHAKTGRYKRRLGHAELFKLPLDRIVELAAAPASFELPAARPPEAAIESDWGAAATDITNQQAARGARTRQPRSGDPRLQRATLEFIREGAGEGERHNRLFQAAANLREFDASPGLALALLSEAALDSGLPPAEVKRAICNGIEHADRQRSEPNSERSAA